MLICTESYRAASAVRVFATGISGIALSFCAEEEKSYLRDIQRLTGKRLEVANSQQKTNNLLLKTKQ
jgi:hypothetical protein